MGIDPVELRRRNILQRRRAALHQPQRHALRQHVAAARRSSRPSSCSTTTPSAPSRPRPGPRAATSASARAATSSRPRPGFGYYGTEGATIRIEPSGKVNVYVAGGSTGNSLETTVVQLAADALGVDIEDVHTDPGRHRAHRRSALGTGGSRSGSMIAGRRRPRPAAILRERIVAIAAHRLEAAAEDIELADGRASVRGTPTIGMSLEEIATIAYFDLASLPPDVPRRASRRAAATRRGR